MELITTLFVIYKLITVCYKQIYNKSKLKNNLDLTVLRNPYLKALCFEIIKTLTKHQ